MRTVLGVTLGLGLVTTMASGITWADKGHGGGPAKTTKVEVRADLTPCCGAPVPDAEGEARRATLSKNGVVQSDQFGAEVEIPLPATAVGIVDHASAAAAVVQLTLSHGGTPYATCKLVLAEFETELEHGTVKTVAEYKVNVRMKLQNGALVTTQTGSCTDTTGTKVLPAVQAGDTATVSIGAGSPVDVLDGTFKTAH